MFVEVLWNMNGFNVNVVILLLYRLKKKKKKDKYTVRMVYYNRRFFSLYAAYPFFPKPLNAWPYAIRMTRFSYSSGPAPIQMSVAFNFIKEDCDANSQSVQIHTRTTECCQFVVCLETLLWAVVNVYMPHGRGLSSVFSRSQQKPVQMAQLWRRLDFCPALWNTWVALRVPRIVLCSAW